MIPGKYKEDALQLVYGYIHKLAIEEHKKWHININDFDEACRLGLSKYIQDKVPFPSIKKSEVDADNRNFNFVQEMKDIELKERSIESAVSNYLRAKKSEIKLLKYEPISIAETLEDYDESILDNLESLKIASSEEITVENINSSIALKTSRTLFHNSINSAIQNISGVEDTQKYYRDGRIHYNVNENKFKWKFTKDDLL